MKRDKHDLMKDPFETKEKADKEKKRNQEWHKARNKGTGRIDRSFHQKMEDL